MTYPNDKLMIDNCGTLKNYWYVAAQLKDIILSSARKYDGLMVKVKGKKELFSNLSKSGGVVDMLNAFKKAAEIKSLQN